MPDNTSESTSAREKKLTPTAIRIEKNGISFNWRTMLFVLVVLAGGGGVAGINLLPNDVQITRSPAPVSTEHNKTHEVVDAKIAGHDELLAEQGKAIVEVKIKIDEVQSVQHKQYARDEARRATEKIKDPSARMREYDRLVDTNLKRLSRGADPCSTPDCEN